MRYSALLVGALLLGCSKNRSGPWEVVRVTDALTDKAMCFIRHTEHRVVTVTHEGVAIDLSAHGLVDAVRTRVGTDSATDWQTSFDYSGDGLKVIDAGTYQRESRREQDYRQWLADKGRDSLYVNAALWATKHRIAELNARIDYAR
jgi:hypothetical protein